MDFSFSQPSDNITSRTITINASPAKTWQTLTDLDLMKQWMFETEINIITDWKVGGPILISGQLHRTKFENTGTVLQFEPGKLLQYTQLNSLSKLPDRPESYSIFTFRLVPRENQTTLTLTLQQFPTETIYKHLVFYWRVALEQLRRHSEAHPVDQSQL